MVQKGVVGGATTDFSETGGIEVRAKIRGKRAPKGYRTSSDKFTTSTPSEAKRGSSSLSTSRVSV